MTAALAGVAFGGAAAGLVQVPTSGPTCAEVEQRVQERRAARRLEVAAVPLDPAHRRLLSLRASLGFAARAMEVQQGGGRSHAWMVTLTYADRDAWEPRHISDAIKDMRRWLGKLGYPCRYAWIGELQDGARRHDGRGRDALHYHIVVWLPPGVRAPHFDARGWWPWGMTQSKRAKGGGAGYLISYCKITKSLKGMPKGARAYGVGGLERCHRLGRRWLGLPAFVRARSSIDDRWTRALGGGWLDPDLRHWPSEWRRVNVGGGWCVQRVLDHGPAFDADGPFSWVSQGVVCH